MRSAGGDTQKAERFDDCFRAHYPRVLAYAQRRLHDCTAAEDIAAEAFVVARRRLDDAPADVLPWLLAIARGMVLNEHRADRRRNRLVARVGADPDDSRLSIEEGPEEEAPLVGDSPVLAALAQLSEADREVLQLATWEALDHRRASKVLGCSRSAYTVRLHRARARLTRELAKTVNERHYQLEEV